MQHNHLNGPHFLMLFWALWTLLWKTVKPLNPWIKVFEQRRQKGLYITLTTSLTYAIIPSNRFLNLGCSVQNLFSYMTMLVAKEETSKVYSYFDKIFVSFWF